MQETQEGVCGFHAFSCLNKSKTYCVTAKWFPDGRRLLTGTHAGELAVWSGINFSFEDIKRLPLGGGAVTALEWSPKEDRLYAGDNQGHIVVLSPVLSLLENETIKGLTHGVSDISLSPNGNKIAGCSESCLPIIWDTRRLTIERYLRAEHLDVNSIRCLKWHNDKSLIATSGKNSFLNFWDPRNAKLIASLQAHKNSITQLRWSPTGSMLLTCSKDTSAKLWDLRTLKTLRTYKLSQYSSKYAPEPTSSCWNPVTPNIFAIGNSLGSICFYDTDVSEYPVYQIMNAHGNYYGGAVEKERSVLSLDWNLMGNLLASTSDDKHIKFWSRNFPGSISSRTVDAALLCKMNPGNAFTFTLNNLSNDVHNSIDPSIDNDDVSYSDVHQNFSNTQDTTAKSVASLLSTKQSLNHFSKIDKSWLHGIPDIDLSKYRKLNNFHSNTFVNSNPSKLSQHLAREGITDGNNNLGNEVNEYCDHNTNEGHGQVSDCSDMLNNSKNRELEVDINEFDGQQHKLLNNENFQNDLYIDKKRKFLSLNIDRDGKLNDFAENISNVTEITNVTTIGDSVHNSNNVPLDFSTAGETNANLIDESNSASDFNNKKVKKNLSEINPCNSKASNTFFPNQFSSPYKTQPGLVNFMPLHEVKSQAGIHNYNLSSEFYPIDANNNHFKSNYPISRIEKDNDNIKVHNYAKVVNPAMSAQIFPYLSPYLAPSISLQSSNFSRNSSSVDRQVNHPHVAIIPSVKNVPKQLPTHHQSHFPTVNISVPPPPQRSSTMIYHYPSLPKITSSFPPVNNSRFSAPNPRPPPKHTPRFPYPHFP